MTYADAERFLFRELRNYRNTGSVADAPADPTTGEGEVAPPRQYPTKARLLTFLAETGHPHAAPGVRYVLVVHAVEVASSAAVRRWLRARGG